MMNHEEVERIAKKSAQDVVNNCCPCVGELIATAVAIEALEHNATSSKIMLELGKRLRNELPEEIYEDLALEYGDLDTVIREPLAEFGAGSWLIKIKENCNIETDDIRDLLRAARAEINKARPAQAYPLYVEAKMKLLDKATDFCKASGDNPGETEKNPVEIITPDAHIPSRKMAVVGGESGREVASINFNETKDTISITELGTLVDERRKGYATNALREILAIGKPVEIRGLTTQGEEFLRGLERKGQIRLIPIEGVGVPGFNLL